MSRLVVKVYKASDLGPSHHPAMNPATTPHAYSIRARFHSKQIHTGGPLQSGRFDSISNSNRTRTQNRQRAADYEDVFYRTAQTYCLIRSYPPVAAASYDPNPNSRPHRWTPALAVFLADVEKATELSLRDNPEGQSVWFQLAAGEVVKNKIAHQVIQRCGRLYAARGTTLDDISISPSIRRQRMPRRWGTNIRKRCRLLCQFGCGLQSIDEIDPKSREGNPLITTLIRLSCGHERGEILPPKPGAVSLEDMNTKLGLKTFPATGRD